MSFNLIRIIMKRKILLKMLQLNTLISTLKYSITYNSVIRVEALNTINHIKSYKN
jgi:hypothetical protein